MKGIFSRRLPVFEPEEGAELDLGFFGVSDTRAGPNRAGQRGCLEPGKRPPPGKALILAT